MDINNINWKLDDDCIELIFIDSKSLQKHPKLWGVLFEWSDWWAYLDLYHN